MLNPCYAALICVKSPPDASAYRSHSQIPLAYIALSAQIISCYAISSTSRIYLSMLTRDSPVILCASILLICPALIRGYIL